MYLKTKINCNIEFSSKILEHKRLIVESSIVRPKLTWNKIGLLVPDHSYLGQKEELHWNALLDGPRSCRRRKKGRLQPPLRHLGRWHHCHRARRVAAPHVRLAPHARPLSDVKVWVQAAHPQRQVPVEFFLPRFHTGVPNKESKKATFCEKDAGTSSHA